MPLMKSGSEKMDDAHTMKASAANGKDYLINVLKNRNNREDQEMKRVEVYLRPKAEPSAVVNETDIRLNYHNHFIDCRDGFIQIRDIDGRLIQSVSVVDVDR